MTRAPWWQTRWILVVGVLALLGCESGPSGPGALEATVTGDMLGGVLLQVDGPGIRGFTALGDARVFGAPDAARPGRHRVIVIAPSTGELRFMIDVDDLEMEGPVLTVLQATRVDDQLVTPSAASVRIVR